MLHSALAKGPKALLRKPNERLGFLLEEKLKLGIHSEVVSGALRLAPVELGLGYVAARELRAGEVLLHDTAFCWAPVAGAKEFFVALAETAIRTGHGDRRASRRLDQQADFYYDQVLKLCTKESEQSFLKPFRAILKPF